MSAPSDLTPESPAVRLYAALHDYEPIEIDTTKTLLDFFKGQNLDLLAAEHDRLVAERLAAVVAERDAAIAERDRLRDALTELLEVARLRGDDELPHPANDVKLWTARMQTAWDEARAALNPEAKS